MAQYSECYCAVFPLSIKITGKHFSGGCLTICLKRVKTYIKIALSMLIPIYLYQQYFENETLCGYQVIVCILV